MAELEKVIRGLECQYEPRMTCYGCDYFIARDKLCNKNKIFREAVDLLKAQKPRVMPADEIVLSAEPSGWLWLEMENGHCGEAYKAGRTISGFINFGHGFDSLFTSLFPGDYGKTWRCWTSRPTDEQRSETPWL